MSPLCWHLKNCKRGLLRPGNNGAEHDKKKEDVDLFNNDTSSFSKHIQLVLSFIVLVPIFT